MWRAETIEVGKACQLFLVENSGSLNHGIGNGARISANF